MKHHKKNYKILYISIFFLIFIHSSSLLFKILYNLYMIWISLKNNPRETWEKEARKLEEL